MIHLAPSASIQPYYVNRHVLITGPTGTGKTVTVMRLIESLTAHGVPVLAADVKGDLAAMPHALAIPTVPVWAFGADLLARALQLTDVQAGVLEIVFAYADEAGAPFDTLADLRAILGELAQSPACVGHIGHVTRASIGTIQRALLRLPDAGAVMRAKALDVGPMIDAPGLHLIDARALYHTPALYGAVLLYLLRDLARRMPEVGDIEKPRLVLVFDEAHTIFHEASPALLRSVEATARLIRSKGIGLVWASQSPEDIPHIIRAQCATTITHSREAGVGRAWFTTLDANGRPSEPRVISPDLPEMNGPVPQMAGAAILPSGVALDVSSDGAIAVTVICLSAVVCAVLFAIGSVFGPLVAVGTFAAMVGGGLLSTKG